MPHETVRGRGAIHHLANTNSTPFNILDYARTAEQIAVMAGQLDALIKDTTGTLDTPALDNESRT